jgi:hypothetical protein
MATIPFTTWYDDVAPYVGAPLPVVLQKIKQAATMFCEKSRTWRYLGLTPIDAVAAQQTYLIGTAAGAGQLPADTKVVHVFQVNWDGEPLDALTPSQLQEKSDTWFADAGDPEAFTFFNEGEVSLWRIPEANAAGVIVIPDVALAPLEAATTIDARIYERHREAISVGARALIYQMPRKPWTDMELGMATMADFNAMAGSAQVRSAAGRGHARIRTRTLIR